MRLYFEEGEGRSFVRYDIWNGREGRVQGYNMVEGGKVDKVVEVLGRDKVLFRPGLERMRLCRRNCCMRSLLRDLVMRCQEARNEVVVVMLLSSTGVRCILMLRDWKGRWDGAEE